MVQFTPYQNPANDPNYLKYSQGYDVPSRSGSSALATGLTEGAKLLNTTVQATDAYFKDEIDKKVYNEINAERTDTLHTGLGVI